MCPWRRAARVKHGGPEAVDASVIGREGEVWSCDIFAACWRLPKSSISGFPEQTNNYGKLSITPPKLREPLTHRTPNRFLRHSFPLHLIGGAATLPEQFAPGKNGLSSGDLCQKGSLMREHPPTTTSQNTERNDSATLIRLADGTPDSLAWWAEQYFRYAVTASPMSQQVQRRDLARFLQFMRAEERTDRRPAWTPRLSSAFRHHLQSTLTAQGRRAWSDRTIVRMLAHLKTFATWVHTLRPFPLGNPLATIKLPGVGTGLDVDRALTPAERRRLLDAADLLLTVGGRSRDRKRYRTGERPRRKGYRPYRNRAMCIR